MNIYYIMNYIDKYNKYYKKYLYLKQRGGGEENLSFKLTELFIDIYFDKQNFGKTIEEFEFQLQNYVNKLNIPIKYENRTIYVINGENKIYVELKLPEYYFNENTFFQENTMHGEPYIVNFLSLGINMYYNLDKSNEKLPNLVAALIYNIGKNMVNPLEASNILNRNEKNHENFRKKLLDNLNILPTDLSLINKSLKEMNQSIINDSRIMRFEIVKMIERNRNEKNVDICNNLWKLVTSNLYDYSQNFTLKDNIFRSRLEKTNDEIKQLVNDNIENYNLQYTDIVNFCLNIKDETNVKLSYILEKIFNISIKAGTSCDQLGVDACGEDGVWNTKNGLISGKKNSPPNVTYFANLMIKFLNRFFPNKIRAFVVGGIFPSYFINQKIKDYDFVMLSNIKDFRNLLLPIIFLFCQFCEVAQGVGKLPHGNIVIKDESKNNNKKPRNFNIRIDISDFEGLDIVLPRNLKYDEISKNAVEEDINMEEINDLKNDQEIKDLILTDLRRRECYLNALYGEMTYDFTNEDTKIDIFDYLPKGKSSDLKQKQLVKDFNNSFRNWQEYPTDGLDTFISDYFRIIRIFKMYLKKFFDPEPSISILNENLVKVLEFYNEQNRDIIFHSSNGIIKMIDLLKSKIENIDKKFRYDQKLEVAVSKINKFGEFLYKLSFIFFIINQNLNYDSENKNVLKIKEIYNQKIENLEKVLNFQNDKLNELQQISYGSSANRYLNKQSGEIDFKKVEKYLTFFERTRLFNEKNRRNNFFYINSSVTLEVFLPRFRKIMKYYLKEKINQDEMFTMLLSSYLLPYVSKLDRNSRLYKSKIKDTYKIVEKLKSQFPKPVKKYQIRPDLKDVRGIFRIHKLIDSF